MLVEPVPFGERRPGRREQAAVERRDFETARTAARMGKAGRRTLGTPICACALWTVMINNVETIFSIEPLTA